MEVLNLKSFDFIFYFLREIPIRILDVPPRKDDQIVEADYLYIDPFEISRQLLNEFIYTHLIVDESLFKQDGYKKFLESDYEQVNEEEKKKKIYFLNYLKIKILGNMPCESRNRGVFYFKSKEVNNYSDILYFQKERW